MRLHNAAIALFVSLLAGSRCVGQEIALKTKLDGGEKSASFSPDGHYLAVGGGWLLKIFNVKNDFYEVDYGRNLKAWEGHMKRAPIHAEGVAFSPDGKWLAAPPYMLSLPKWEMSKGQLDSYCGSLVFAPDSKTVAGSCIGARAKMSSVPDGQILKTWQFKEESFTPGGIAYSPDGKLLAGKDVTGSFTIWSLPEGAVFQHIDRHGGPVNGLAFSPDGKKIASASGDGTIKIWRVADAALYRTIEAGSKVLSVAFSPDGHFVVGGCADKHAKIWRLWDGALVKTLDEQGDGVTSVVFSPDGTLLVTVRTGSSGPNGAYVWSWIPPKEAIPAMTEPPDAAQAKSNQARAKLLLDKATASLRKGSAESAMKFADASIKADPEYGAAYSFRARRNFLDDKKEQAHSDLDFALKNSPRDTAILFYHGLMNYGDGKYEEASADFVHCTHYEGCDPKAHIYIGLVRLEVGHDGGEAADEIETYLKSNPNDKDAQDARNKAETLFSQQDAVSKAAFAELDRQYRSRQSSHQNVFAVIGLSLINAAEEIDNSTSRHNEESDAAEEQHAQSAAATEHVYLEGRRELEKTWGLPKGTMAAGSSYVGSGVH